MRTKEEVLNGMSEVEFWLRCKIDFRFFVEQCIGLNEFGGLHDFQLEWFTLIQNNDATIIEAPSGFSKTEIVGVAYTIWYMLMYPNSQILLISKTIAQAKDNLLSRIKGYIEDNGLLKELMPEGQDRTWNVKQIKTTNNCTVTNVPYNVNIKGYRAHLIMLDEMDSYEDTDIYFDHVTSRLHPGGKICGISTPEDLTRLIGELKAKSPRGYVFKKTVAIVDERGLPMKDNFEKGFSIWPERFSIDWLMRKRDEMGKQMWAKNYLCDIMTENQDAIFSVNAFVKSYDRSIKMNKNVNPLAQYFIGADFAISKGPKADFDAYVVIEKLHDHITIKHIETHHGLPRPKKVNRLLELYNDFQSQKTTKIIADESNMGTMVIQDLRARGATVVNQNFHYTERKKLLLNLANVLESGSMVIPRYPTDDKGIKMTNLLLEQLIGFKRKVTLAGTETIESKAPHDDVAMSLAMAIREASKMKSISCVGVSCK